MARENYFVFFVFFSLSQKKSWWTGKEWNVAVCVFGVYDAHAARKMVVTAAVACCDTRIYFVTILSMTFP